MPEETTQEVVTCVLCESDITATNEERSCPCGETACDHCMSECTNCSHGICPECRNSCFGCGNYFCGDCITQASDDHYYCSDCNPDASCSSCGNRTESTRTCHECRNDEPLCSDCSYVCRRCENVCCIDHQYECSSCGYTFCTDCVTYDDNTESYICGACNVNLQANSAEDETLPVESDESATTHEHAWKVSIFPKLRKKLCKCCKPVFMYNPPPRSDRCTTINWSVPQIRTLEYSTKPSNWPMFKMAWENTLYMGMEWEMNFDPTRDDNVKSIVEKYFSGSYIWKRDASVNPGAELVLAPRTLQSYHTVDLYNCCRELHETGARGYNKGQCGIHIHVNKDGFEPIVMKKIMAFFIANRTFIRKFAKRENGAMEGYAIIPEHIDKWFDGSIIAQNRHIAINSTNQTWEFRVFRSTTKYERIKATLEFVDAIINFATWAGTPCMFYGNSLHEFASWLSVNGQYTFLYNYLKEQKLIG